MDNLTKEQRKKNMQNIRSKNTVPELILRKALWNQGIRYRTHCKKIFGNPDICFIGKKIAIFVDSEFWHGKNYLEGKIPKSNQEYWIPKLEKNIQRDELVNTTLQSEGWNVLRFWEADVKKDLKTCVETILDALNG